VVTFQSPDDPVGLAVDLANTWDTLEPNPELLRDVASLKRFLTRRGYGQAARVSTRDLDRVRAVRESLRTAFSTDSEERAVRELNRVVSQSSAKQQLVPDGGGWQVKWVGPVVESLAATAAMSLLEAIRDDGWERFGMCAGAPCCCVFVDRSKSRTRRFCSSLCADRVAQSLYRARRRGRGD
jgi:predicted RNA-binding Zn ribbon-like protein